MGLIISKCYIIIQMKTKKPVKFEITKQTRDSLSDLINSQNLMSNN